MGGVGSHCRLSGRKERSGAGSEKPVFLEHG
jgi:hypothetical protein